MSLDITCLMQYDLSSGALQSPIVALLIVSLIYGFLLFCSSASTGSTSSDSSATSRNSADSVKRRGVDQNDQVRFLSFIVNNQRTTIVIQNQLI